MVYVGVRLRRPRLLIITLLAVVAGVLLIIADAKTAGGYDTEQTRRTYLASCGWQVGETVETDTVRIPETFTPVYENYNALQRKQGFDLSLFAGKTVTQYRYTVTNHPAGSPVYAHLLVLDGVLIGGDVMSPAVDGFMDPLKS